MSQKILVTYATKSGSTREIAEAIGEAIRSEGFSVDVIHIPDVTSLSPYAAVVIGSPIYAGKLLKPALKFVQEHKNEFVDKPVAAFTVGASVKDRTEENLMKAEAALAPVRSEIQVMESEHFAGKFDAKNIPVIGFFAKLGGAHAEDYRDWNMIRAWGQDIAKKLGLHK